MRYVMSTCTKPQKKKDLELWRLTSWMRKFMTDKYKDVPGYCVRAYGKLSKSSAGKV